MRDNLWEFVKEEFDSSLPRMTAIYVKEEDESLFFSYPVEGDRLGYYFNFTDKTGYDIPPKFRIDFAVYEYPSIMRLLANNRVLFKKQEYYPSMIKRNFTYTNLGLVGTERMGQRKNGSLTWLFDFKCINEGFKFEKQLFSILSSDEEFTVAKENEGLIIKFEDINYYIACSNIGKYGVYPEELSMKKDLSSGAITSNSVSGHYLVIAHDMNIFPGEKAALAFGLSSISSSKAVEAVQIEKTNLVEACEAAQLKEASFGEDFENDISKRWNNWFTSLPYIKLSDEREKKAYYKCWWVIKNNYYNHPEWGFNITESLPVYKGLWQWAIPSIQWHSDQNTEYTSQWIKKGMDMFVNSQREDGYITHAIYIDEEKPGERWAKGGGIIQTPHLPWVALRHYNSTGDLEALVRWYPAFVKYYDYICRTRDQKFKNIHLWGIVTSFDTGLDTTSAFQRVTYGENGVKEAYCYPSIFAAERCRYEMAMGEIAEILEQNIKNITDIKYNENITGIKNNVYSKWSKKEWYREAEKTREAMNSHLWDSDKKWYGVLHEDGTLDTRVGVDGMFPLVYHLVEPERAATMEENFMKLIGNYGIRTVAPGEPGFRADVYWRGAAWPKPCSLGMEICRYYFPHLMDRAHQAILAMALCYPSIWECVNAETGELARSDHGFICTPGMSSNVGAGDIIGSIWMYHGLPMYDMDMVLPLVEMKDFHWRGMRITAEKENGCWKICGNSVEKDRAVVHFYKIAETAKIGDAAEPKEENDINSGKVCEVKLCNGESVMVNL
ncbi:MAG TPA: trehalase family glycosidase [Clostridiales bacterium]|nr:trehalase family glycosidase [Clostridiales bacterium]